MSGEFPVSAAAFIGRERERAKVADLLTHTRVTTLTGTGGCGKTRLAQEVAGDVASRFDDGVRWVDLQAVTDPSTVASVVGEAVDVPNRPGETMTESLVSQLRDRYLLLVLDNCEHLVDGCAQLVSQLSTACPRLHIMATSRLPLAVEGEATFGVAPLSLPHPGATTADAVAESEAVRLFEVRARQVSANFRIRDDNATQVAEICRRLDGIPLAIELAAARMRVLGTDQIESGLSDRFRLLTDGIRGAPDRQRTLEASLDWSYGLLDDEQRAALARLSVFAGSFDLNAAGAVIGDAGADTQDVLEVVTTLVEHSLLQVDHRQGNARYRLLETIRTYASERLSEDDFRQVGDRHLSFYVGLAEQAHTGLAGRHPESWMERLTYESNDLRKAMDWAVHRGDVAGLVALTERALRFWFERGLDGRMQRQLYEAVTDPDVPIRTRARGLTTVAMLGLRGEPGSAYRSASRAVEAARAADLDPLISLSLSVRAQAGAVSGLSTNEEVEGEIAEAVRRAEQCADAATYVYVLPLAGWTLLRTQTIDAGYRLLKEAIEVGEAADVAFHLPAAHAVGGLWPLVSGQIERTQRHARRGCELARALGRPGWEAVGLTGLGAAALLQGDNRQGYERLSQAQAIVQRPGMEGTEYDMFVRPWLALAALASGELASAREMSSEVVRIGRMRGSRWDQSIGEWLLALCARGHSGTGEERAHLEASLALADKPRFPFVLGRASLGLADLAADDGDVDEALELAHHAVEVLNHYGDMIGTAAGLETIADLTSSIGRPEQGFRLLAASQQFHTATGIARIPAQAHRFAAAHTTARAALDPTEAAACWSEGSRLSLSEAVSYTRRGRGARQRPRFGWQSLTPTERNVVRLVAQGHSNAEIGERLFVSVNTVKKHLSHVYAKVDVGGRADLAAEAVRRGI